MSFGQVQILCKKVQNSEEFRNCSDVAKMKFSKKWWNKFETDRGITWRRICGDRKTYTRDESSYFPEFNGHYSLHSPEVEI